MNILIVSLVTGSVVRTTFAAFAQGNADLLTPAHIQTIADELTAKGSSNWDGSAIINTTPTEADVVAWLRAQHEAIDWADIGISAVGLNVSTRSSEHFSAHGWVAGSTTNWKHVMADSIAGVIAKLRVAIPTGAALAEQKRQAAHKLLAEAEAIEAGPRKEAA